MDVCLWLSGPYPAPIHNLLVQVISIFQHLWQGIVTSRRISEASQLINKTKKEMDYSNNWITIDSFYTLFKCCRNSCLLSYIDQLAENYYIILSLLWILIFIPK